MTLIGRQTERDDGGLALETRARRRISNEFRESDDLPWKRDEAEQLCRRGHPEARLVCSSALYNCGGLVFGARRVWIDPSEFRQILRDDGYRTIAEPLLPGDVVLYGTSSGSVAHVGMVHCTSLEPISKMF